MTEKHGSGSIKSAFMTTDNMKAKPIDDIAMAGVIVIAALLVSGLSLVSSYEQQVIAQEEVTGGADGTTAGDGGTTGGNATTAGGNQTTSEIIMHLEEVRTAIRNGDTQGALMHLDLALMALGANTTITAGTDTTNTYSECGGVTVGGTSAADDYGCPPDPDY